MAALYDTFRDAPSLGSLINPARSVSEDMLTAGFDHLEPLLERALRIHKGEEEWEETAIAARGLSDTARLLSNRFELVVTNVPYLGRGKQAKSLKIFCEEHHEIAKADISTCFVRRCLAWCSMGGSAALVTPQNWLFLTTYSKLREEILTLAVWKSVVKLGPAAFQDMNFWAATTAMVILSNSPSNGTHRMFCLDVSEPRDTTRKAELLTTSIPMMLVQSDQLKNPDARISFREGEEQVLLAQFTTAFQGIATADYSRFGRCFWEVSRITEKWEFQQSTVESTQLFGGREHILFWEQGQGDLASSRQARVQGLEAHGKHGVVVSQMNQLPVTLYTGELFDNNCAALVVHEESELSAVWTFCASQEYRSAVREIDQQVKVTNATLTKVGFDSQRWRKLAKAKCPDGMPCPSSSNPTQWIFHGNPSDCELPLQVAIGRVLGYRWPAENDSEMELAGDQ